MINLQDIRQKYTNILEQVEKKVFDSYLLKYIDTPIIDEDKLLILISIMDRLELSYTNMQTYAMSTMLIQIALDTHEHITNTAEDDKSRQLTVLAGDYFSGLYYKLLADSEDILMIKALSDGVKTINESKVLIYQTKSNEIDKLMNCVMIIESSLLAKFSEYFKVDLWNEFHGHLLFYKRVLKERSLFLQSGSSRLFDLMKTMIYPKNNATLAELSGEQKNRLLMVCDRYLEISKQVIQKGIPQLPYLNDLLESRISFLLDQHQPMAKTFVEEG